MTSPDLSALVSARLCHDLISPMGAIGNGLELMQLAGGAVRRPSTASETASGAMPILTCPPIGRLRSRQSTAR